MEINKIVLKSTSGDITALDLTQDTAVEDKVLKGYTFHKANGEIAVGTATGGSASKIAPTSISFLGYLNDTIDLACLDTSNVTSMNQMFYHCFNLRNLNLSSFDTSNVTYMSDMFTNCAQLSILDLSSFDTSNVTNMNVMFNSCSNLRNLNLSSFDTSNVTSMFQMFNRCSNLRNLNLSSFDTSNVTSMFHMFYDCSSLINLNLSSFDTSNVTNSDDMSNMFGNCLSLQTLKLPGKFNECNSDLGLLGLSNLSQILVPTPALSYYTDSTAEEHCPYFTDNDELKNKIVGYDIPTTTYTFVTDGGTPVEPITTNGFLQNQVSTPTTENYIFKGWYFDSKFTKKVKFPYLNLNDSKTNITLYAKYVVPDPVSKQYAIDINAMSNPAEAQTYIITGDYEATGLGNYPDWKSVWFKYTPAQDCNISLINWTQDLNWQVIKADNNSLVAENDPENAQVPLTANTQYYIAIAIWNGRLGSFTTGFNIQGV